MILLLREGWFGFSGQRETRKGGADRATNEKEKRAQAAGACAVVWFRVRGYGQTVFQAPTMKLMSLKSTTPSQLASPGPVPGA